jgi:hypothetical protein
MKLQSVDDLGGGAIIWLVTGTGIVRSLMEFKLGNPTAALSV